MEKRNCTRYSEELRTKIIAEYAKKELGYRKIAKKFGMTRDTVRGIILRSKHIKCEDDMKNISCENPKINTKNLDKNVREYIKDLEAGLSFFRNYSTILEKHIKENKKK